MAANSYVPGDGFQLQATFTKNNVNTDPTTVTFKFKDPAGVITTYVFGVDPEIVKSAVGTYYMDVTVSDEGQFWYRIEGTGAVIAALEYPYIGIQSQF